jgi:hypothetical protein
MFGRHTGGDEKISDPVQPDFKFHDKSQQNDKAVNGKALEGR